MAMLPSRQVPPLRENTLSKFNTNTKLAMKLHPFLLLLAFSLSATAAHAATADYAGKYAVVVMGTSGPVGSRDGLYGTCTVTSTGGVTMNLTREISGNPKDNHVGQKQVLHGSVSSTGVLSLTGTQSTLNVKFIKNGSTVIGLQGTFTPKSGTDSSTGGILLGLKQ
jgi:hypothetical protein